MVQSKLDKRLEGIDGTLLGVARQLGASASQIGALQVSHDESISFIEKRWRAVEEKIDILMDRTNADDESSVQSSTADNEAQLATPFFDISRKPCLFRPRCAGCSQDLCEPIIVPEPL